MNQKGSVTLVCMLLMSIMMATVGGISKLVTMEAKSSHVKKSTVNSYHLAESAVELFVDGMNRLIEESHPQIIATLKQDIKKQMEKVNPSEETVDQITYEIDSRWVQMRYLALVYEILLEEYCYKSSNEYRAKTIRYEVKTEGDGQTYTTQIKLIPYFNAKGFSDQDRNKELIDTNRLFGLKDFKSYKGEELTRLYEEVLKKLKSSRYRDVFSIKAEVDTLGEGRKVYNKEKVISKIKGVGLERFEYKMIDKNDEGYPMSEANQMFDLYILGVPLKVKIGNLKSD
ncbi:MAG: hypothetical protein ACRC1P_07165 [Cellulosilyticaceae bacterium]